MLDEMLILYCIYRRFQCTGKRERKGKGVEGEGRGEEGRVEGS